MNQAKRRLALLALFTLIISTQHHLHTIMKLTFALVSLLASLDFTDGFAPRLGYSLQSITRSPRSFRQSTPQEQTNSALFLRASTLELQETETKSDLPFYAKDASALQTTMDAPLSSNDYQRQTALSAPKANGKFVEFAALGTWIAGLSSFLLVNNFVGPWPAALLQAIPVKFFGLAHALSAMLFGGGIILTTLIEWLATDSKNSSVLNFYFDKVPALDSLVVLPALTVSILSGVGLSVDHYDSLGQAPFHVVGAISTLLAFAIWWASTDLTTQGTAMEAIQEWTGGDTENAEVPQIVQFRKFSNVVSCIFVAAIYGFMVLKPGFTPPIVV